MKTLIRKLESDKRRREVRATYWEKALPRVSSSNGGRWVERFTTRGVKRRVEG